MDKVPKTAARGPDSDDDVPSIEDMQNTGKWEDRLAQARIRRAEVLAKRRQDATEVPSTNAAPKSANLNIRLAQARDRNSKSQSKRSRPTGAGESAAADAAQEAYKKTVLVALTGVEPKQTKTARPDNLAAAVAGPVAPPVAPPVAEVSAPAARQRRRTGAVYISAAMVIALLVAVALPGPFRDFTIRSASQLSAQISAIFAAPPVAEPAPVVAEPEPALAESESAPVVPDTEPAFAAVDPEPVTPEPAPASGAVASSGDPAPVGGGDLAPVSAPETYQVAARLALPTPDNFGDAELQVPGGIAAALNRSAWPALAPRLLTDLAPTQANTAPAPPAPPEPTLSRAPAVEAETVVEVETVAAAVETPPAVPPVAVAVAPALLTAIAPLPGVSESSVSGSVLATRSDPASVATTLLSAAILSRPGGADMPVPEPEPLVRARIAVIGPATTVFAALTGAPGLNANVPRPFADTAPVLVLASLSGVVVPGQPLAVPVSPEPPQEALVVVPIARPEIVGDEIAAVQTEEIIEAPQAVAAGAVETTVAAVETDAADANVVAVEQVTTSEAVEDVLALAAATEFEPVQNTGAQSPLAGFDIQVHAPQSVPEGRLGAMVAALRATGYSVRSPVRVGFTISRANVRYFHAEDAESARDCRYRRCADA